MKKSNLKSIIGLLSMGLLFTVFVPTDIWAQGSPRARKVKAEKKEKPRAVKREMAAPPVKQYSKQPRRGAKVSVLPQRTRIVKYHNSNYHYRDGIFYRLMNGSYIIAPPPIGIHISILPPNSYRIRLLGRSYYYYYGTYYMSLSNGRGYEVVAPPVGARVDALPEGYEVFELEGMIYYRLDETFYKAVLEPNGYVMYEVVRV